MHFTGDQDACLNEQQKLEKALCVIEKGNNSFTAEYSDDDNDSGPSPPRKVKPKTRTFDSDDDDDGGGAVTGEPI